MEMTKKPIATQNKPPKKSNNGKIFTLFVGFFLIIRGVYRIVTEAELSLMGILMLVVGIGGIVYYFLSNKK